MPALLTGSGRPGFYFRVLHEGDVGRWGRNRQGRRGEGAADGRRGQCASLFVQSPARSVGACTEDRRALIRLALVVRGAAADAGDRDERR